MFVGDYLGNMISVLHHHHAAEDEVLWPKLYERIPSCDTEIQRAEGEHVGIAELIDKVQSVLTVMDGLCSTAPSRAARCCRRPVVGQRQRTLRPRRTERRSTHWSVH